MTVTQRRTKSEEKRQQMLVAASKLFLSNGFERISMDQVAEIAGVSKQTLYSHFGSKEELFTAVIERKCGIHELTGELFDIDRPVHTVLKELAEHFCDLLMSDSAIATFRVCLAECGQRSQMAEVFWKAGIQRLTQQLCHYLEQQNQRGKLTIDNPHFAAQQLLSMIRAEAYLMKALGQPDNHNLKELPAYLDSCVAVFEKAYANPKPQ